MRAALTLARRGLGNTWPNPSVGCVLAKDEVVVGRGWTQPGGRPHAETEALARAGNLAKGATAYVTLEPCSHQGETPPCTDALIKAGVTRVVSALGDPDKRVAGSGIQRLREATISVDEGCCEEEAAELNAGYLMSKSSGRPLFTLKSATSIDGRIALASGESKWITGSAARSVGHQLRLQHDAVLIGVGTAIADDPELTCRLPGIIDHQSVRIVIDSNLRTPLDGKLVRTATEAPVWLVTAEGKSKQQLQSYLDCGVDIVEVAKAASGDGLEPNQIATELMNKGITRVLIEGGAAVASSFLKAGLIDRINVFRGPKALGGDGLAQYGPLHLEGLDLAPSFDLISVAEFDGDVLETYTAKR